METEKLKILTALMACEAKKMLQAQLNKSAASGLKEMAKKALGRGGRKKDPLFWPAGMLMLGLLEAGEIDAVRAYLDKWEADGKAVYYPDDALAGYCMLQTAQLTGEEKYLKDADVIAEFLEKTRKDEEGAIVYDPGKEHAYIFADGVGMCAMFLSAYGKLRNDERAVQCARKQLMGFAQYGMDARSDLPYHAYELSDRTKHGIIGWGRAVGWLMMGFNQYLSDRIDEELSAVYARICAAAAEYTRADGLFSWQLQATDGPADSSATAMIFWSLLRGAEAEPSEIGLTIDTLAGLVKGGRMTGSLSECVDFAQHPQSYGANAWGQGGALALFGRYLQLVKDSEEIEN